MPECELREVSDQEWTLVHECVVGCLGIAYHVPNLAAVDYTIKSVVDYMEISRRSGRAYMIPGWLEDIDRLMDRRLYLASLPAEGAPIDG